MGIRWMIKGLMKECTKLRRRIDRKQWKNEGQKKIVLQRYAELVNLLIEH
jgi:peptidyl-tRNA hydrolase